MKATIAGAAIVLVLTGCAGAPSEGSEHAPGGTPTVSHPTGAAQAWWYDNQVHATDPAARTSAQAMVVGDPVPIARRIPGCVLPQGAVAVPWDDGGGTVQCTVTTQNPAGQPVVTTVNVRTFRKTPTPQQVTAERAGRPAVVGSQFVISFIGPGGGQPPVGTAYRVMLAIGGRIAQ